MTQRINLRTGIRVSPSDGLEERFDHAEGVVYFGDNKLSNFRVSSLYGSDSAKYVSVLITRVPFRLYRTPIRIYAYLYLKDYEGGIYTMSTFSVENGAKVGVTGQGGVTQDYIDMCQKILDAINASGSSSGS